MILARRPLRIEELVIPVRVSLCRCSPALHAQPWAPTQCCAVHIHPLAAGQAWFAGSSHPPGTRDYTTCVSLPLPKSAATSYHVKCFLLDGRNDNRNVFLLSKSYKSSKDQNEVALPWMGSAWHVVPWLDICLVLSSSGFPAREWM